jgi:hypothetical protein
MGVSSSPETIVTTDVAPFSPSTTLSFAADSAKVVTVA